MDSAVSRLRPTLRAGRTSGSCQPRRSGRPDRSHHRFEISTPTRSRPKLIANARMPQSGDPNARRESSTATAERHVSTCGSRKRSGREAGFGRPGDRPGDRVMVMKSRIAVVSIDGGQLARLGLLSLPVAKRDRTTIATPKPAITTRFWSALARLGQARRTAKAMAHATALDNAWPCSVVLGCRARSLDSACRWIVVTTAEFDSVRNHVVGCDMERCPQDGSQALQCECRISDRPT